VIVGGGGAGDEWLAVLAKFEMREVLL